MNNQEYWENRAVWNLYENMKKAEQTADDISAVYLKSSRWLQLEAEGVFEKYKTKHKLSEKDARDLLNSMDGASVQEMLRKLKNGESDKPKKELLAELEAPAYQARISRLAELQKQIERVMQNIYQLERQISTAFYESFAKDAYYQSVFELQKRSGLAFSFSHISTKQIDRVLSMNWSGQHYSTRIWKNTSNLAQTLKEEMLVNLLTGRTEGETAELIQDRFTSGAMQARRLVRTESCFISGELTAESYKECEVEKYRYLATLDLRTSKICRSLDGQVFLISERKVGENYPPLHPWCRSTTISIVDEETLARLKRRAYNPKTGATEMVPATMTYGEWYKKYVEGLQEAEAQEKAIQHASSDRKQYAEYREVLGSNVPDSFVKFQEMKYNEPEKWEYTKLDYQRRNRLLQHPELKLPDAENAVLPDGKFTKYLFGGNNADGLPKGKNFEDRLGYNLENWQELQKEIQKRAPLYPAAHKGNVGFGDKFEQKMILYGLKDKPANVVVGWIRKSDGTTSMTSTYIKEK